MTQQAVTLHEKDYPTYKLKKAGIKSISDADLLAILIGSEPKLAHFSANYLLTVFGSLSKLSSSSIQEITNVDTDGIFISEEQAQRIVSAFELYRRKEMEVRNIETISSSKDSYSVVAPILNDLDHEEIWIVPLNFKNVAISKICIGKGGATGTVADVAMICRKLLESKCTGFIMAHNHPSGGVQPSQADIILTKKVHEAANLFEIKMLDHIIVARDNGYYSFADEGMMYLS